MSAQFNPGHETPPPQGTYPRHIPIIRNNPKNPPELPAFLSGRLWLDFRDDTTQEAAYERLLRDIHGVAVDAAPPIGRNPFEGRTDTEASLAIRNSPGRWHNPAFQGDVKFPASQNSGNYRIGSGKSQFTLNIDWLGTQVRAYRDAGDIAHVAVISRARERTKLLADVSQFDTSNRVVYAGTGDAFVLHNCNGFWALLYIDKLYTRAGQLNREDLVDFRYAIQPNRTPDFSGFVFPGTDADDTETSEPAGRRHVSRARNSRPFGNLLATWPHDGPGPRKTKPVLTLVRTGFLLSG